MGIIDTIKAAIGIENESENFLAAYSAVSHYKALKAQTALGRGGASADDIKAQGKTAQALIRKCTASERAELEAYYRK